MDFMVVLGSDDGLIASGERTFISGLAFALAVTCWMLCSGVFLVSNVVRTFHNLLTVSP